MKMTSELFYEVLNSASPLDEWFCILVDSEMKRFQIQLFRQFSRAILDLGLPIYLHIKNCFEIFCERTGKCIKLLYIIVSF